MTKPEGPKGYVAHKFVVSGNGNKCGVCGVAHNGDASTWVPDVPATPAPSQPGKQAPERTISDECKYCAEGEPEWSTDASCWIHRRPQLDKRCTRKTLSPIGELPVPSQPAGAREFWQWAEENAVNGALRIDERWRVDEVAIAYARQQTAAKDAALQAAERERDSLREANARLAADLNAALKAGKESHGA